jgi:hypothetical protein
MVRNKARVEWCIAEAFAYKEITNFSSMYFSRAIAANLCQLRTDGLAPASKYWTYWSHASDMGPVSLVVCRQQMLGFTPTASLIGLGGKLGTDSRIGQPTCCGLCQEPLFSGTVTLLNSIDDYAKGCYMGTTWYTYGRGSYVDRAWKACGVLVEFFPTGCTSVQITATIEYGYRLFVTVIM